MCTGTSMLTTAHKQGAYGDYSPKSGSAHSKQRQNVRQVKYAKTETTAAQDYCATADCMISFLTSPLLVTNDPRGFAHGHEPGEAGHFPDLEVLARGLVEDAAGLGRGRSGAGGLHSNRLDGGAQLFDGAHAITHLADVEQIHWPDVIGAGATTNGTTTTSRLTFIARHSSIVKIATSGTLHHVTANGSHVSQLCRCPRL